MEKKLRFSGVLLHPTSLPGGHGIGDLGPKAMEFVKLLSDSSVSMWQILPLSPVGYGNSPYAAQSAFAGNELLISLELLYRQGLLAKEDLFSSTGFETRFVDYPNVQKFKLPLLRKAVDTFLEKSSAAMKREYEEFQQDSAYWLDDYALYKVMCDHYNDSRWFSVWDRDLAERESNAVRTWTEKKRAGIERYKVLQFFFHQMWDDLHEYATEHNVAIVGDLPIFVAHDSVDAWCHRSFLKMDSEGHLEKVAGVPPDAFSPTGQLWGNPVYDWDALREDGYSWWVRRMTHQLKMTDMVRIDHFRGFDAAWEVPAEDTTAENGSWVKGPGQDFFSALKRELKVLPVIAEDLGVITPSVEKLRDDNGFPGMRILQFGFNYDEKGDLDASHFYLPHNYDEMCVAYTGTHDNNTSRGWYDELPEGHKDLVRRYLSCDDRSVVWYMIRSVMASGARWAIVPFQDLVEAGANGRMNFPGTCSPENWAYRIPENSCDGNMRKKLEAIVKPFGRTGNYLKFMNTLS